MAEVVREAVKNFRFEWDDRLFKLSASVGVVPITADNADVASILSAAEGACAAAKEQGRNRVHSFAENDIELMRRRRETHWGRAHQRGAGRRPVRPVSHAHHAAAGGRRG